MQQRRHLSRHSFQYFRTHDLRTTLCVDRCVVRLLRRDETKRRKSKCESLCGLWTLYLVVATLTVEEHSCNAFTLKSVKSAAAMSDTRIDTIATAGQAAIIVACAATSILYTDTHWAVSCLSVISDSPLIAER